MEKLELWITGLGDMLVVESLAIINDCSVQRPGQLSLSSLRGRYMSSKLQLNVSYIKGGAIWWIFMKERQAWCICKKNRVIHARELWDIHSIQMALYKYSYVPLLLYFAVVYDEKASCCVYVSLSLCSYPFPPPKKNCTPWIHKAAIPYLYFINKCQFVTSCQSCLTILNTQNC